MTILMLSQNLFQRGRTLALALWNDRRAQDLIEYALMAGFVAVAAGAVMPGVADSISTIFSKISSTLSSASTQGG
jgi:Flp pilus assembly pilin Flp